MEPNSISEQNYNRLVKAIFPIILNNGMKATTMDSVAATLSISKRTLYEIFGSKNEMLKAVIKHVHLRQKKMIENIFKTSDNMMEALYRTLRSQQKSMKLVSVEFFRDMDVYYKDLRGSYDEETKNWYNDIFSVIKTGISQGVFLKDLKYEITLRMLRIQMESLKRMEEFLPHDVTLSDAFDAISTGFLRSIASPKGLEIIETFNNKEFPEPEPFDL